MLVCAHVDTVFSAETDLSTRQNGHLVYGPGLGDNSIGVAALLALPEVLAANGLQPDADVWLAATVCEEGLGNLLGMERALERLRDRVGLVVVVEGMALGHVFHEGLGVRRLRVSCSGPGGHSWLNRDRPSAINSLLEIGIALSHVPLPEDAPASLNVGLVEGGTSVNSIAAHASLCLDLRSESGDALDELEARVMAAIHNSPLPTEISVSVEAIGERPTGSIARNHPLVRACKVALQLAGVKQVVYEVASTEANLPLANGLPAVCIGITTGANAHSPDEYVDTRHVAKGMQQLVLLTLAAAQHSAEWAAWDNVG